LLLRLQGGWRRRIIHLCRHIHRVGIRGIGGKVSLYNPIELAVAAMGITLYILVIVA
jgi:hypothetical protein